MSSHEIKITSEVANRIEDSQKSPSIVMYSTNWCPDCFRAKKVMQSMQVQFDEINITEDEEATEMVIRMNNGHRSVPTIVFPDGSILTEPSTVTLVQKLQSLS